MIALLALSSLALAFQARPSVGMTSYEEAVRCAGVTQAASELEGGESRQGRALYDAALYWSLAAMQAGGASGRSPQDAEADQTRARIAGRGIRLIESERGLDILGDLMASAKAPGLSPQVAVISIDWPRHMRSLPPAQPMSLLYDLADSNANGRPGPQKTEFIDSLLCMPPTERDARLRELVAREAAKVMGLDAAELGDGNRGFFDMGMDSLMAVDLKNRLQAACGKTFPATLVFNYPNVNALCKRLAELMPAKAPAPAASTDINAMTDADVIKSLQREFEAMK